MAAVPSYDRRLGFTNPYSQRIADLKMLAKYMEEDIEAGEKQDKERTGMAKDAQKVIKDVLEALDKWPLVPASQNEHRRALVQLQRDVAKAGASNHSWPDLLLVSKRLALIKKEAERHVKSSGQRGSALSKASKDLDDLIKLREKQLKEQKDIHFLEAEVLYKGLRLPNPQTGEEMDVNDNLYDIWEEYIKDEPKWRKIDILVDATIDLLRLGNPDQLAMFG